MEFKGKVEEIIYTNEENGYTVMVFDAEDKYFTAVGIFPLVTEGEMLKIEGEFKDTKKYGEQFVVTNVSYAYPEDVYGVYKYLSSGLFKGIGEKTAKQIVDKFGIDTLKILDETPHRLLEVTGIGRKKLMEIICSYNETRSMKETILFLQNYEISMNLAMKIYRKYGENTVDTMKNNPYILVEDIDGVGFITADKIAKKLGIPENSEFRIRAGLNYLLNEQAGKSGHTCLPEDYLVTQCVKLLGLDEGEIRMCYDCYFDLKREEVNGQILVATAVNYHTENAIANKLLLLDKSPNACNFDLKKELEVYERQNGIALDANQRHAIKSVFSHGVSVITGGPGTGKTTIIKGIVNVLRNNGKKPLLCAPTGRASKRMMETTGEDAKTIHRMLGMEGVGSSACCYDESTPLPVDVLIVDEISMADIYIFNTLLKAIPVGARLVLVGDKDQLPSVACGNILSDIICSDLINIVYLTTVYRQAQGSTIVSNAHRINSGLMPETKNSNDFFFNAKSTASGVQQAVLSMIKTRIPNYLNVSRDDIQVLAPMRRTEFGVEALNELLQRELNENTRSTVYKDVTYKVCDRVMQTVNNYELEWSKTVNGKLVTGKGVFNGDIGMVVNVDKELVAVEYDDGKMVKYVASDIEELTLAYCVSVHKSQGSEFPVVILVLGRPVPMLHTRNLIYTAVTRAKKMLVIIGEESVLQYAINNTYTAKRYSLLCHLLNKQKDKIDFLWGNINIDEDE